MYVQILLSDPDGNDPTWQDAHNWAYEYDHDDAGPYEPPLGILVLADTDGQLWSTYSKCPVTPQMFIIDQGGLMIDDACTWNTSELECLANPCGSARTRGQGILDGILPPAWCGESDP